MARIERTSSAQPIAVEQAQLIDPNAFRFSTAGATALSGIGNVLQELGQRKRAAQDSLAINEVGEARDLAQAEMQQFMVDNPDPDTWSDGFRKIMAKQQKVFAGQKFSPDVLENEQVEQDAFFEEFGASVELAATTQTIENDIVVSGKNLINAIATDDGSVGATATIDKQMKLYQSALERKDPKDIATLKIEETLKEAKKGFWENQAKLFPADTIRNAEDKKETLRNKGIDKDGLSAKDYDAIIGSAITAQNQARKIALQDDREAKLAVFAKEDSGEALTRDDFNSAWSDPSEADGHYDEYVAGQLAASKGEANFVKQGDPIVLARTEALIDLTPLQITEEDIYTLSTRGIGTDNITRLVDRLRKAKKGLFAPIDKYNTQLSTLFNVKYFGETDEAGTTSLYLELKRKMTEFVESQDPTEAVADAFFNGLITKDFKGFFRGGFEEEGFKHTFVDAVGNEVTQRFRFGDIRNRKVDGAIISEFYAGTDDDGDAIWLPRR